VWLDIQEQVAIDRANINEMFSSYAFILEKLSEEDPGLVERSALSTVLHSFYSGIENIFKRISLGIDGDMPSGSASHSALLSVMVQATDNRPPVISKELQSQLSAYLSFRHAFRHMYTFQLKWSKMYHLVLQSEETWQQLKSELDSFFMRSA